MGTFSMGIRPPLLKRKSLKDEDANLHARSLRAQDAGPHPQGGTGQSGILISPSLPAPTHPPGMPLSWLTGC